MQSVLIASLVSAVIAGIIIFGKAMGKRIALDNCDNIVLMLGKLTYVFTFGRLSLKNKNKQKNVKGESAEIKKDVNNIDQ